MRIYVFLPCRTPMKVDLSLLRMVLSCKAWPTGVSYQAGCCGCGLRIRLEKGPRAGVGMLPWTASMS